MIFYKPDVKFTVYIILIVCKRQKFARWSTLTGDCSLPFSYNNWENINHTNTLLNSAFFSICKILYSFVCTSIKR